jgi:hypothetical protein
MNYAPAAALHLTSLHSRWRGFRTAKHPVNWLYFSRSVQPIYTKFSYFYKPSNPTSSPAFGYAMLWHRLIKHQVTKFNLLKSQTQWNLKALQLSKLHFNWNMSGYNKVLMKLTVNNVKSSHSTNQSICRSICQSYCWSSCHSICWSCSRVEFLIRAEMSKSNSKNKLFDIIGLNYAKRKRFINT